MQSLFWKWQLKGACYSGHEFPAYEDIETVLTKAEYNELIQFDKAINDLGYVSQREMNVTTKELSQQNQYSIFMTNLNLKRQKNFSRKSLKVKLNI